MYQKNKEKKILYSKTYQEINREKQNRYAKIWRDNNPNPRAKLRIMLLQLLGNRCCKCGFEDVRALQFDHIKDDGYLDKQRLKHANSIIAYYYKNPEIAKQKLQILCANCNWIKRFEINKHNQYNR